MVSLGSKAANFSLLDVQQFVRADQYGIVSLSDFQAKPLLVMFICNHCPYVIHIAERMAELANEASTKGIGVVAISANDAERYPQDGPLAMAEFAALYGFNFPYLYDETQSVATAYSAACTPDFYVFDADHCLVYRGQMDGSRPGNSFPVTGDSLAAAITAVHQDKPVDPTQIASIGCSIKWKLGNEPEYF